MDVPKAVIPSEPSLWPEESKKEAPPWGDVRGTEPKPPLGEPLDLSAVDAYAEAANVIESETMLPLVATLVSTRRESVKIQLEALEKEGIELANKMAITVTDQASYDTACLTHQMAKSFIDRAGGYIEPLRAITFSIYNKVLGRKKTVLGNVENNLKPLANNILAYERAREAERIAEQQRLERLQKEDEDNRRLALAQSAEQAGMDETSIEEILAAPSIAPTPVAAPTYSRVAGTGSRDAWAAEPAEGLDAAKALLTLVRAAAKKDGAHLLVYLEANMTAINGQARIAKAALAIPGFRGINKGSLVNRK